MTEVPVGKLTRPVHVVVVCLLAGCAMACTALAESSRLEELSAVENAYADLNDANGAIALIDSGLSTSYAGRDRQDWAQRYAAKREEVKKGLAKIPLRRLSPQDERAVKMMRASLESLSEAPNSLAPVSQCKDAQRADLQYSPLREALYACFAELANNLEFEGGKVNRVSAFDLLTRLDEPQRRKDVFYAFVPLWQAINGNSEPQSPYRRMIAMAVADAKKKKDSPIDAAARTVGTTPAGIEAWLEQILDTWRQVSGDTPIEPWDYRYVGGVAERELGESIAREAMQPLNERYYFDLGADLQAWGAIYRDTW